MRDRDATPLRTRAEQIIDELAAGSGCDCAGWELCRTCAPVTKAEREAAQTPHPGVDDPDHRANKPAKKGMTLGH